MKLVTRRTIGIEIEEKYCQEAMKRTRRALRLMREVRKLR
jgi:hypothetical protein